MSNYLEELADSVALEHWAQPGEQSFKDLCTRVAYYLCDDKHEAEEMCKLLEEKKFIPNSPCWINAGTSMKSLAACYVVGLNDSMSDIMDTAKKLAMIMKEGGGVGVSLSRIRPEGARVGGPGSNRSASGPISFLRIFDSIVAAVKSAGVRRGAALANLRVDHPDIVKFIRCKENENEINNFNLSVALTDDFMDKVINHPEEIVAEDIEETGNNVEYSARELYDMIVDHMWRNGEPGVQFIDNVNNSVKGKYTGRPEFVEFNTGLEVSNPCVTGDTLVLTDKGYLPIKDCVGKKVNVWNGFSWSEVEPRKTGENQKLMELTFSNGATLRCTPYHKFILKNGDRVECKDLEVGDRLIKNVWPVIEGDLTLKNAYTQGFFSGDGSFFNNTPYIQFYGVKIEKCLPHCSYTYKFTPKGKANKHRLGTTIDIPVWDKTFVPGVEYTVKSRLEWLAGLCDSDGSWQDGAIFISSVDRDFLDKVSRMLNTMGIGVTVGLMKKACIKNMPDGRGGKKEYPCQDCWRITINAQNVECLNALGFQTHRIRHDSNPNRSAGRFVWVTRMVEMVHTEDVYCFTEPLNHSAIFNGVCTAQCGETFLKPGEACNLGAINLYKFVVPFWEDPDDNKEIALRQELAQTICSAVDYMNYMIDKNEAPLEEINEAVRASRKIGIGVMGLADYLSAKGIVYGSAEAVAETEKIIGFITETAEEYALTKGYRNATLTLIAPTGTTGLVGGVSQGIEPHFLRCWQRHSLKMGDLLMYPRSLYDYIMSVDDEELTYDGMELINELRGAIANQDFNLFNKLTEKKSSLLKPWITAHEVTPQQHLDMLLAVQRNVHNSVSKTINLPHDCTPADIHDLIIKAWMGGAKGFTCYRDGSRESQVLKSLKVEEPEEPEDPKDREEQDEESIEAYEPVSLEGKRPRPDVTIGETVKMKIGCGGIYVTVNQDAEGICEVFTNLGRAGGCPSQSEATSRLISLALRSGVKVSDVIDQLKGIRCMNCMRKGGVVQNDGKTVVFSCPDAIGRTLEKAYKEYSEVEKVKQKWLQDHPVRRSSTERLMPSRWESLEKLVNTPGATESYPVEKLFCPECGKRMQMASGCVVCNNCGYSKCG